MKKQNVLIIIFIFMFSPNILSAQTTIPLYKEIPNSWPAKDYKENAIREQMVLSG